MYIQIKKLETVQDRHGSHLAIKMVGLYEDNGNWVKWQKLSEIKHLLEANKIPYGNFKLVPPKAQLTPISCKKSAFDGFDWSDLK